MGPKSLMVYRQIFLHVSHKSSCPVWFSLFRLNQCLVPWLGHILISMKLYLHLLLADFYPPITLLAGISSLALSCSAHSSFSFLHHLHFSHCLRLLVPGRAPCQSPALINLAFSSGWLWGIRAKPAALREMFSQGLGVARG